MSHWVIIHCLTSFSSLIQKEFKFNLKYCLRRFLKSNASVGPRSSGTTLIFKQELFKTFFPFLDDVDILYRRTSKQSDLSFFLSYQYRAQKARHNIDLKVNCVCCAESFEHDTDFYEEKLPNCPICLLFHSPSSVELEGQRRLLCRFFWTQHRFLCRKTF